MINKDNSIIQLKKDSLYLLVNPTEQIKEMLKSEHIFFKEQFDYIVLDKYASTLLYTIEKIGKDFDEDFYALLEKIKLTEEFAIYKIYISKQRFVMFDSIFGSLFAIYNEVR